MAVNIKHKRGDTLIWGADCASDLTGYAIKMQIRKANVATPLADLSIGAGIEITDIATGKYTIRVEANATKDWPVGQAQFDIQYTVGAVVASTETGAINVIADITQ